MIADEERARAVAKAGEALIRELGLTLDAAPASCSPAEFEKLKHDVGRVIGSLEVELMWPLYTRHPDLEPENLKGWEEDA